MNLKKQPLGLRIIDTVTTFLIVLGVVLLLAGLAKLAGELAGKFSVNTFAALPREQEGGAVLHQARPAPAGAAVGKPQLSPAASNQ